ncbi:MAG: hypothetical protein ACPL88_10630, partial [Bryobacteraceae bacterium]
MILATAASLAQLAAVAQLARRGTGYTQAMGLRAGALLCLLAAAFQQPQIERLLARASEEAEIFRQRAVNMIARETLRQRALRQPPRLRPRAGKAAFEPPPLEYRTREIVSEYTYGVLSDSPHTLHEFRRVIRVDGREVAPPAEARRRLIAGMHDPDDRVKLRLLEEFARY